MTATELIEELKKNVKVYGDHMVVRPNDEGWGFRELEKIVVTDNPDSCGRGRVFSLEER